MVYRLLLLLSLASAAKRAAYYYPVPSPYVYTPVPPLTAVVNIMNYGGDAVTGRLMLTQLPGGPVLYMGNVTGLTEGAHGLHIHEFGDLSKGCDSLGAHFNPTLNHHGGPADPYRHVGDLGNIMADKSGNAKIAETDHVISLTGPHSVIGRGLAITAGKDDYGRGGDKESLRTGNSGKSVACGVVVWAMPPQAPAPPKGNPPGQATEPDAEPIEP